MKHISLRGTWILSNEAHGLSVAAELPGDTHSALIAAGVIADPYYGEQEQDALWVGQEDWHYEREFEVDETFLNETSIFINIENLDTLASIFLNGELVAHTQNAFVRYRFEVKPLLRLGENHICIKIHSAEQAAKKAATRLPYNIPHMGFPVQSPHRNLIRKTQCHSGWDWGPCLMVSGVYGDIYLGAVSLVRIEHVLISQTHSDAGVTVEVSCEVEAVAAGEVVCEFTLGEVNLKEQAFLQIGSNHITRTLIVTNPRLWWPNGYGEAYLYDLRVAIGTDSTCQRVGLRTIEVRSESDACGRSLEFLVNGVPIFIKGANWIPADALPQRITPETINDLLDSATHAHMNMIRVWGGGQYETDSFYDLCDQKGLLVWQDFMFSCALYPANSDFLANVHLEAEFQVKRLQHRTCLAIWCGNNENIGVLMRFKEPKANPYPYTIDYDRLNDGVLGSIVRRYDPSRMFWPSSPCGGPGDFSDGWHNDSRGDMHFWGVWARGEPFENYLKISPRFCSEFGYQSFPSLDVVRSFTNNDQQNVTSPTMEYHQRNPGGNARILENFARYFRFPSGFENMVYLSQVQQGIAIRTAVEHFRRLRPTCMGALYWQLNDVWPACSWSSIDYGGKWKLLHYMAKQFYAPLLISVTEEDGGATGIWISSDLLQEETAIVTVRLIDFSGTILLSDAFSVHVAAATSQCIQTYASSEWTSLAESLPSTTFLHVALKTAVGTSENSYFFTHYKACTLQQSHVVVNIACNSDNNDNTFVLTLTADRPAFFVALDVEGIRGQFSDNVFTLTGSEPKTIVFTPKTAIGLEAFRSCLRVYHLRDSYK